MACTQFPKDGLVPDVTPHVVGDVTYLYKGGAPTAPLWEAITAPLKHNQLAELDAVGGHDAIYSRTYATFASLLASPDSLATAKNVKTSQHTSGGIGGAEYVKDGTTGTANTGNELKFFDAQGNGWNIVTITGTSKAEVSIEQLGGLPDWSNECGALANKATTLGYSILIPKGCYKVDPTVSIILEDGVEVRGFGRDSQLLADYNKAGSIIRRVFNPVGTNQYVQNCKVTDCSVFMNHLHQETMPTNIQKAVDFSNVTRSKIEDVYAGNFRYGQAETYAPNAADNRQAMRGYCFVLGNVSGSDPAYAGGEVNKIIDCRGWWARKAITIDDLDLTGGNSASYNAVVEGCDVQTVERGIVQESQYNTGCAFKNNVLQDLKKAAGSVEDVFGYYIGGYKNEIQGGYVETNEVDLTQLVRLASTAYGNMINPFYHEISGAKFFKDDSGFAAGNIIRYVDSVTKGLIEIESNKNIRGARAIGWVTFDSAGTILDGHNFTNVVINGAGDVSINWAPNVGIDNNSCLTADCVSNGSGHPTSVTIGSHSGTTTRIYSYNLNGAGSPALETFPKYYVVIR